MVMVATVEPAHRPTTSVKSTVRMAAMMMMVRTGPRRRFVMGMVMMRMTGTGV